MMTCKAVPDIIVEVKSGCLNMSTARELVKACGVSRNTRLNEQKCDCRLRHDDIIPQYSTTPLQTKLPKNEQIWLYSK